MKKTFYLVSIVLAMMLNGCSSKPDVSDVEPGLKTFWAKCNMVKPTDFKKTNGIEQGNQYQMAISYKLEVTRDIAEEDIWTTKVPESITPKGDFSHLEFIKKTEELNAPRYAAIKRVNDFYANNCPAPLSIYFQDIFGRNKKYGQALKKGEIIDVATEFTMIKSEKGWIIQ